MMKYSIRNNIIIAGLLGLILAVPAFSQTKTKQTIGIKSSFAGGEFAPALYSRVDLDRYATGARTLRNIIVQPHGPASNRPGFEYIATAKTSGKKVRVIPFEFSTTQTYVIEFGNYYCRFYKDGARINVLEDLGIDSNTKLMLHCDGIDATTTFTDDSDSSHTVTAEGTAQIDTAQKRFGTASGLFDGNSDYLSVPDSADWDMGTGAFTIDFQIRFSSVAANMVIFSALKSTTRQISIEWISTESLKVYTNGTARMNPSWTPVVDTWYHIEASRGGGILRIFADGVLLGSVADTQDCDGVNADLAIGWSGVIADARYFDGWLDEFRISKGVARHIANFSIPASAYSSTNIAGWVTATGYVIGDFVENSDTIYYCIVNHTSGTFATDLSSGYWVAQTIYEIPTPYSEIDIAALKYTQSADVLYLAHPDFAPRQLERSGDADWDLNLYDYTNGPFQISNVDTTDTLAISAVTGSDRTLTASGFTFSSLQVGSLFRLSHDIEGQAVSAALASVTTTSAITASGTWRFITHGTWTGTIRIEKSIDSGSTWTMLREFSSADDYNTDTFGIEDMSGYALPFQLRINMTARSSGTCNINLSSDPYVHEGVVKITAIAVGGITATADVIRTCGATSAISDWAESSWSNYRGWPAEVEFHPEDRLMWANTYNEPYTYWMTETGNYISFARNDPLVDSDGIGVPVPARKVNGINGLIPLSEMIALTLANEIGIRSSSGPISPTTIFNKIYGWEGSFGVKPLVIGNRAIYVQSTGAIIRDLGFTLEQDSFVGADLSIFSTHLFETYTIVELAYQQNPDRLVWAVRSDGKLLSMTYMREQKVIAWTWHDTGESAAGDDSFESICTIRGTGYDEVWVAVERDDARYIERLSNRLASTDPEDSFFVDCGTKYDSTSPTLTVTGLTQLASKAVSALADGVVISGKTVSAGGVLTLDDSASKVNVGLGYNSDIELLNANLESEGGTTQGRKIKPGKAIFRVLNTRGGNVGPSSSSLFSMGMGSSSALFSGDHPQTIAGGYTSGGRIFVRQSDPLPMTITGIIVEYTIGGITQNTQ